MSDVILLAGYPVHYPNVYQRVRLPAGDMTVFVDEGQGRTSMIVRPIEMARARGLGRAAKVYSPEELAPPTGLDSDRNTAFAQATAHLLTQRGVRRVVSDAMLPLLFHHVLGKAGIEVRCDPDLGTRERRSKDDWEVSALRKAQQATEAGIRFAYETIREATVGHDGVLQVSGGPLTSSRLRGLINNFLMDRGCVSTDCITACGPIGADCHHRGDGPLREGLPIILDVFPMDTATRYFGDCTRTLCRGTIPRRLEEMHAAVVDAKRAAIAATRAGVRGSDVHKAACDVFRSRGYMINLPAEGLEQASNDVIFYGHGTGHGIGLEGHEGPYLDERGDVLVAGDALTIEPALYTKSLGGVRVEDMVIVRPNGSENLNSLPEGLWWD